jgi:hypothetical protein
VPRDRQRRAALHVHGHVVEVAQRVDAHLHVTLGLLADLAGVERLDLADDRLAALDLVGQAVDPDRALVHRQARPALERFARGTYRAVDVARLHGRDLGQVPAAAGVDGREGRAVRGVGVAAAYYAAQY